MFDYKNHELAPGLEYEGVTYERKPCLDAAGKLRVNASLVTGTRSVFPWPTVSVSGASSQRGGASAAVVSSPPQAERASHRAAATGSE